MTLSDVVERFFNSEDLMEFLQIDLRNVGEVAGAMDSKGHIRNINHGDASSVSLDLPNTGSVVGIHTHPSTGGVDISEQDIRSTNPPNIDASIILCQELFDTKWTGICFRCENMDIVESKKFKILCDGTTDGPAEERHISNPELVFI